MITSQETLLVLYCTIFFECIVSKETWLTCEPSEKFDLHWKAIKSSWILIIFWCLSRTRLPLKVQIMVHCCNISNILWKLLYYSAISMDRVHIKARSLILVYITNKSESLWLEFICHNKSQFQLNLIHISVVLFSFLLHSVQTVNTHSQQQKRLSFVVVPGLIM